MKRILALLVCAAALLCVSACGKEQAPGASEPGSSDGGHYGWMQTECSKESVKEFMAIIGGEVEGAGLLEGSKLDEEHCYNVTPERVAQETDIKIFKFSDSCATFALIDGGVFEICRSFGGWGFFNAVPWDYDKDGTTDLLIASSWGSGVHCSEISVFDCKTKTSKVIATSFDSDMFDNSEDWYADWFIDVQTPSLKTDDEELSYVVYSARVEPDEDMEYYGVKLFYSAKSCVGTIEVENGEPCFIPYEAKQG